ncbi:MAG: hypothetical protein ACJ735_06705 [Actinomycetes bacterium]
MRRARPRAALPGLAVVAAIVAGCGGGHTVKLGTAERDCASVVQAANAIQVVAGSDATASDIARSNAAAAALTTAAANATTAVAGPAGQLATTARAYAEALGHHNIEGINTSGGKLRQQAAPIADVCKTTVLGVAPPGPTN